MLAESAGILAGDYPGIDIRPVEGDFTDTGLVLPSCDGARLAVFLGGTIGNFDDDGRRAFFTGLATTLAPGDYFLLGADLIKDTGRLVAAYNDKAGVTADFNRNMIEVLRTGLDAVGLYADDFDHIARWNPERHRIEMWLRARRDIDAYFGDLQRRWRLPAGAEIRTEISTKFDLSVLQGELADAGLAPVTSWTDRWGTSPSLSRVGDGVAQDLANPRDDLGAIEFDAAHHGTMRQCAVGVLEVEAIESQGPNGVGDLVRHRLR